MDNLLADRIGGAVEAHALDRYAREHGGVSIPDAYRRLAREILEHNHVAMGLTSAPQLVESGTRHAYVSGGWWLVRCAEQLRDGSWGPGCRNCPHVELESKLAICLNCGRVYDVVFPPDRKDAENALLARPDPRARSYFWHERHPIHLTGGKPESVADLDRQNADHGIHRKPTRRR